MKDPALRARLRARMAVILDERRSAAIHDATLRGTWGACVVAARVPGLPTRLARQHPLGLSRSYAQRSCAHAHSLLALPIRWPHANASQAPPTPPRLYAASSAVPGVIASYPRTLLPCLQLRTLRGC